MEIKVSGEIKLTADTALLDVLDRLTRLQVGNIHMPTPVSGAEPTAAVIGKDVLEAAKIAAQTATEPDSNINDTMNNANNTEKDNDKQENKEATKKAAKADEATGESDESAGESGRAGSTSVSSTDAVSATAEQEARGAAVAADNGATVPADTGDKGADSNSDSGNKSGAVGAVTDTEQGRKPVTMAMIRSRILPLIQGGKQPELKDLLDNKYKVKGITALPKETWEDFAADIRALGADI